MSRDYNHLFGPVPSRRLGISLGVDLVPLKICSLNCVYCECGKTNNLTIERKEYSNIKEIISELDDFLKNKPVLDFITLTGSGEPTLNIKIKEVINFLKINYKEYKIALLTNGTLLWDKILQSELLDIDVVKISLDCVSDDCFKKLNIPAGGLSGKKVLAGVLEFAEIYKNKIWIEVFIVPGINDNYNELELIKNALIKIKPDKIHLNALDRPAAFDFVKPVSYKLLEDYANFLKPLIVEIAARKKENATFNNIDGSEIDFVNLIKRRPCTVIDLQKSTGLSEDKVLQIVSGLIINDIIVMKIVNGIEFYSFKSPS